MVCLCSISYNSGYCSFSTTVLRRLDNLRPNQSLDYHIKISLEDNDNYEVKYSELYSVV
jgi:hypothetical protein